MGNEDILKIIKKLEATWRLSFVKILDSYTGFYSMCSAGITIINIEYENQQYELIHRGEYNAIRAIAKIEPKDQYSNKYIMAAFY